MSLVPEHHHKPVEHHQHEKTFSPQQIAVLRRILDMKEEDKINDALMTYSEIVEVIHAYWPNWGPSRAEWALAMAMSPEWYGDDLSSRLQNSMLVSALLLTITATYFVEPPEQLGDRDSHVFRGFIWVCGLCNMFYILSIVCGIFFIENAMSRTYGQSERFYLIMKYFEIKNLAQYFSGIGNVLFPIVLALPMQKTFLDVDAYLLWAFTGVYAFITLVIMIITTLAALKEQSKRLERLHEIIDMETSRLKPEYYPKDAIMSIEEFQAMYFRSEKER